MTRELNLGVQECGPQVAEVQIHRCGDARRMPSSPAALRGFFGFFRLGLRCPSRTAAKVPRELKSNLRASWLEVTSVPGQRAPPGAPHASSCRPGCAPALPPPPRKAFPFPRPPLSSTPESAPSRAGTAARPPHAPPGPDSPLVEPPSLRGGSGSPLGGLPLSEGGGGSPGGKGRHAGTSGARWRLTQGNGSPRLLQLLVRGSFLSAGGGPSLCLVGARAGGPPAWRGGAVAQQTVARLSLPPFIPQELETPPHLGCCRCCFLPVAPPRPPAPRLLPGTVQWRNELSDRAKPWGMWAGLGDSAAPGSSPPALGPAWLPLQVVGRAAGFPLVPPSLSVPWGVLCGGVWPLGWLWLESEGGDRASEGPLP